MNQRSSAHSRSFDLQEEIRAKSFHPSGTFVEFSEELLEQSVVERFEKIVALYPDRIAVRTHGHTTTYAELNAQANRVAHHILLSNPKKTGAPIGLLLEPTDLAIGTVIGVLKSGNIYVPLDPSYPRARILSILDDSGAGFIVADAKNIVLAAGLAAKSRSCLTAEEITAEPRTENPCVSLSPTTPMAIFYTSGTTGQPKGVVQNHRNVLHRIMVDTNNFHISRDDRLSLLSSPSYSVSLRNLFGGLLNGAAVCPFDASGDGLRGLKTWLIQESVTIYFSVPTVFRQLVESIHERTDFSCLRLMYLGGETVTPEDVRLCQRYFPKTIVVNSLASNETGIIRIYYMDKDTVVPQDRIPAGYAVAGKEILVVNENGERVGTGDIGEICVRSRYLSPGYWRNPDLTEAAFKPDPEHPEIRLYHTGDLGYLCEDDCLIHLGRKGSRAKIRGARVELEEVEAALREHPAIRDVVVDTVKGVFEADRLIAYVVLVEGQAPTITELRHELKRNLPPYMIPSSFIFLTTLPLTPNGKIDRQALPKPDQSRPELKAPYVPPRTADEEQLVEIWSKVLSIDRVGVQDNFFDLGGNSLAAAVLVSQINRGLSANLTISAFYQAPTVEMLVKVLSQELATFSWSSLFPIQLLGVKNPFFWIHGQNSDGSLALYLGADQPIYGIHHQSADGKPAQYKTVEEIAAHYLDEIRTVRPRGPYLLGGYCFGGIVAYEIAQQLKKCNEEIALLVLLDPPVAYGFDTGSNDSPFIGTRLKGSLRRRLKVLRSGTTVDGLTKAKRLMKHLGDSIKTQALKIAGKVVFKTSLMFDYTIPLKLRGPYIFDVYTRAMRRYCPEPYPGRIVVFKAADVYRDRSYSVRLAPKTLQVDVISGNHDEILTDPHLKIWAEKLKGYLDATPPNIADDDRSHPE